MGCGFPPYCTIADSGNTQCCPCAGEHEHTIIGYSLVKGIGDGEPIASERFTVGGHEWVLLFYPDGKRSSSSEAGLGGGVGAVVGLPPGAGNGFEGEHYPRPCRGTVLKNTWSHLYVDSISILVQRFDPERCWKGTLICELRLREKRCSCVGR